MLLSFTIKSFQSIFNTNFNVAPVLGPHVIMQWSGCVSTLNVLMLICWTGEGKWYEIELFSRQTQGQHILWAQISLKTFKFIKTFDIQLKLYSQHTDLYTFTYLTNSPLPPIQQCTHWMKGRGGGCLQNYRYISIPKWYQHKGINFAQSNCNLCSFTPVQSKIACNFDVQMKINNWAFTIDAASTSLIVYVSLGFASGNIKDLGITNYCFPGFEPSK